MKLNNKHLIYPLIFAGILLALLPVILSDNFLRQDDLTFDAWHGMHFKQLGYLYYNGVFQLVRPIGAFFNYLTFIFSINMQHAVYIRAISIILIGIMAILVYHWQCKFNSNKTLAASFAIAAFTLPCWQLFAATANYICIIFAALLAIISMFCMYQAFYGKIHKKTYRNLGYLFFFLSLLDYPLSSMFVFTLLGIVFLNGMHKRFLIDSSLKIIGMMAAYFILIKLVHLLFHVKLHEGRVATLDLSNLFSRFEFFLQFLGSNSHLWFFNSADASYTKTSLFIMFFLPLLGSRKLYIPCGLFILYLLSYSPALTQPGIHTFRYILATMPLVLYSLLWSLDVLIQTKIKNILPILTVLFGISYSNIMLADGIVGPHTHDFIFIQQQLAEKVLPLLRQGNPVILHVVDYDGTSNLKFGDNVPTTLEYGLRIPQMHIMAVEAISHSLMKAGYSSNFGHELKTKVDEKDFVVTAPWGMLVANNDINSMPFSANAEVIVIDLREITTYKRYDFYKRIIGFC